MGKTGVVTIKWIKFTDPQNIFSLLTSVLHVQNFRVFKMFSLFKREGWQNHVMCILSAPSALPRSELGLGKENRVRNQHQRASYFSHGTAWPSLLGLILSLTKDSVLIRTDTFLQSPVSASNTTCGNGLPRDQCIHSLNMASHGDEYYNCPRDPSPVSYVYLYKQQQLSSMINIGIANKY